MISIISGTNRPDSLTKVYADHFFQLFKELGQEVQLLSLEDLPQGTVHSNMYIDSKQDPALSKLQDQYILEADAFFIVIPEYNGSYPGVLKTFIDACSVRAYKESFSGKKVALLGVASGRAGNLRGIDHLTGTMHHMGSTVMPKAIPYGQANSFLDDDRKIVDPGTLDAMRAYAERFAQFIAAPAHSSVG